MLVPQDDTVFPTRDVRYEEAFPTDTSLDAGQDRENIAKTFSMPHEALPMVTSLGGGEGRERFKHGGDRLIEDLLVGDIVKDSDKSADKRSDSTNEMANVLGTLGAANILASGGLRSVFTTASLSVATASTCVSTAIATASGCFSTVANFTTASVVTPTTRVTRSSRGVVLEQMSVQLARDLEAKFAQEDQIIREQAERDSEIARIHAERELEMMITELDKSNEMVAKYLSEYEQAKAGLSHDEKVELIDELFMYQRHLAQIKKYQDQQNKAATKTERRNFYMSILRSNAETKRLKRPGIQLDKERFKKLKTTEDTGTEPTQEKQFEEPKELSEEELKKMMELVAVVELYIEALQKFNREDLDKVWILVKETCSKTEVNDEKAKELWVELKRLYEPDSRDLLWALQSLDLSKVTITLQAKAYDSSCGIQQVEVIEFGGSYKAPPEETAKDKGLAGEVSSLTKKKGRTVAITAEDMQKRKNDVKARTTLLLALLMNIMYTLVWRNRDDLDTMSLKDVYNHLNVYGPEVQKKAGSNSQNMAFIYSSNTSSEKSEVPTVQGASTASAQVPTVSTNVAAASLSYDTFCAFIATQPNGSQFKYEDTSQIDDDDIKEMDIKWNLALLSMMADRGKRESYKKNPNVEEPAPKTMIAINGIGWDWSYMVEEGDASKNHALVANKEEVPTKYALMAKSSSSSDNEVYDDSFCSKSCRKNTENLNTKTSKLNEELSNCETKLYNYKRGSQKLDKDMKGVGFNEYCAVSPPPAQVYSPPKKDLSWVGLPEFVDDTATDYTRPIPSIDVSKSISKEHEESWKSNNPSFFEQGGSSSNVVSKPMIKFVKESGCPNATKVNNTKNARKSTMMPFERKSAAKNQVWPSTVRQKIPTVGLKVPAAKPKVAADKENNGKAVKASAHWIWKPKQNSFGQGSNFNGVSVTFKKYQYIDTQGRLKSDNIDDKGYWDSGCSRHITGNMSYLSEYEPFNGGYVSFGHGRGKITGKGSIRIDESMLWHRRLGHLKFKTMNKLVRSNLYNGLPSKSFENDHFCIACLKRKQHKASFVTDDFSRISWTFFLKSKDETSRILRNFITKIENLKDLNVKIIRSDNEGEFRNKEIDEFCSRKGIKKEFSNARTHQQNGVAEKRNKTLIEAARTMLADAKLPVTFWAKAVNTACYVQNRVLVIKPHNKTPYELFNKRSPAIGFLRPFGCHVMILNFLDHLGKFNAKGDEAVKEKESLLRFIGLPNCPKVSTNNSFELALSSTVETVFPIISTPDPTDSLSVPLVTSSIPRIISRGGLSFPEPLSLGNAMSFKNRLEDFFRDTSKAVSLNDVVADLSNMETAIQFSLTPSLRIHKDHPKSQIISPVDTPVQTRQKIKNVDIVDALKDLSWVETMQQELLQFKIQNVWVWVDCPSRVRPIGMKWVLKNKKDEKGTVIRKKARLVAQGHTQEEGIDYEEVFAPVARIKAIRLFLAYASYMGFTVYQMDVKSASPYGTIDKEVYVMQPPGFQDPEFPHRVYKVEKAMYGLHQAPRAWYGTLSREFEALMHEKFQMSAMGDLNFFLGLQVLQKKAGIFLSQDKYVGDILKKYGYTDIRATKTLMDRKNPRRKDGTGKDVELHLYRSMIRSLMYLIASRPDIMFAVCAYARHQVTPNECHLHAVKRIFRYLKGNPKLGLWYPKESLFDLVAYSDSDYGGANQDRKSTTRGCQFLGRRLISWENIAKTSSMPHEALPRVTYLGGGEGKEEKKGFAQENAPNTKEMDQGEDFLVRDTVKDSDKRNGQCFGYFGSCKYPSQWRFKVLEQMSVQLARDLEAKFAQEDQIIREQAKRDSKIARIHAERELKMMIAKLDRSNEMVAKYLSEYEQAEAGLSHDEKVELIDELFMYQRHLAQIKKYQDQQNKPATKTERRNFYMLILRSNAGWKATDFKGMTFEQIEEKFILVWEKMFKKLKTDEAIGTKPTQEQQSEEPKELSKEELKKMMELVPVEELYIEALQETCSRTEVTDEKAKELWVKLKRLINLILEIYYGLFKEYIPTISIKVPTADVYTAKKFATVEDFALLHEDKIYSESKMIPWPIKGVLRSE
uniref:Retrovirus-related Pol polyprotein from transposon TNT 1-94 n=1 Tax=Tanacetum cinerariifolium TaxID=118510 RepID=A0A699GZJ8_TANCI|nr:retrovirus-related Pol polyprotein from transposon TNT 1-94 [Tanacetum cinerariifolium]